MAKVTKSKVKAKGSKIDDKILIQIDPLLADNWCNMIKEDVFSHKPLKANESQTMEYIVELERIDDGDDDKKPDEFSNPADWQCPFDTPRLYKYIVQYCQKKFKVPAKSRIKIFIGEYMRLAPTHIEPPSEDTVNRIIFNFKNKDLYRLEPGPMIDLNDQLKRLTEKEEMSELAKKFNAPLEPRTILLEPNRCFPMGPVKNSNYYIDLNAGKEIRIPPPIEGNLSIKGMNSSISLKPLSYARITIVVDIMTSVEMMSRIAEETFHTMEEHKDKIELIRKDIIENNKGMNDMLNDIEQPKKKRKRNRRKKAQPQANDEVLTNMQELNDIVAVDVTTRQITKKLKDDGHVMDDGTTNLIKDVVKEEVDNGFFDNV